MYRGCWMPLRVLGSFARAPSWQLQWFSYEAGRGSNRLRALLWITGAWLSMMVLSYVFGISPSPYLHYAVYCFLLRSLGPGVRMWVYAPCLYRRASVVFARHACVDATLTGSAENEKRPWQFLICFVTRRVTRMGPTFKLSRLIFRITPRGYFGAKGC